MLASRSEIRRPWWTPERETREELIDSFDQSDEDLLQTFQDIQTFNRLFGGTSVVLHHLRSLLDDAETSPTILDVASGLADIPREIIRCGRKRGMQPAITALDANKKLISIAEQLQTDGLTFVEGDARALPFPNDSFDIVTCSLALHHFSDSDATQIIKEMARVARKAIIVNDLRRAYLPAVLIWIISRLMMMNRLAKHDAHLSVLKSRTMAEYGVLASNAGFTDAKVYKHPFWRAAIVWRKG